MYTKTQDISEPIGRRKAHIICSLRAPRIRLKKQDNKITVQHEGLQFKVFVHL